MQHPGWYLIAYDIADPRRLRRLHRVLRAEALAIQESLFLVRGTVGEVEGLLDRLEGVMDPRADDLRAYPIAEPARLWLSGQAVIRGPLLSDTDRPTLQRQAPAPVGWRSQLAYRPLCF
jgi:CRISPR/Cas system-associated endoribonuclease Cas2